MNPVRLNKFLAARLGVSRREADDLIAAGKITVDGSTAILGAHIDNNSKVCYNNKIIPFETEYLYLALNKPAGYVCSRRAQGFTPTLYELLPEKYHNLKTVGRLDKDTSGLILLTNDGDFAFQMTHPKFRKEKIYEVTLNHPLAPLHQQMISDYGVMLDDGPSKFTVIRGSAAGDVPSVTPLGGPPRQLARGNMRRQDPSSVKNAAAGPAEYTVVLSEGRNRQIRRTFAALGYQVTRLHRTQFGKYVLNGLAPGKYVIIEA
ncbi:rRNA pseudouridine synthase [Candidatus Saccharibacteria bacterium]|nr:rRNA pseudouridine synthase [Candidatus Saccharibacteria bacterium]